MRHQVKQNATSHDILSHGSMYKELNFFLLSFFFSENVRKEIEYSIFNTDCISFASNMNMSLSYFGNGLLITIYQRSKVHSISRTRMPLVPSGVKSYDAGFVSFIGITSLFQLDNWFKRTTGKNENLGLKLTQSLRSFPLLVNLKQFIYYNSAKPIALIGLKVFFGGGSAYLSARQVAR